MPWLEFLANLLNCRPCRYVASRNSVCVYVRHAGNAGSPSVRKTGCNIIVCAGHRLSVGILCREPYGKSRSSPASSEFVHGRSFAEVQLPSEGDSSYVLAVFRVEYVQLCVPSVHRRTTRRPQSNASSEEFAGTLSQRRESCFRPSPTAGGWHVDVFSSDELHGDDSVVRSVRQVERGVQQVCR